jgi:nucleoid-associated protein YgaU
MVSPQRSVPATSSAPARLDAVRPTPVRPVPARAVASRAVLSAGRAPQSAAPVGTRRDPVRPGGRPARLDGMAAVRPVRGGCLPEVGTPVAAPSADRYPPAPLRLTERGRRVVAGLSIAIGLSIAAATVVIVELQGADGGLQLAGASTVVVQPGDTLWSIARSVAPEEDPRAVVDAIVDLNGLDGVDLLPGAELQLP